jgi:hypothetical protein
MHSNAMNLFQFVAAASFYSSSRKRTGSLLAPHALCLSLLQCILHCWMAWIVVSTQPQGYHIFLCAHYLLFMSLSHGCQYFISLLYVFILAIIRSTQSVSTDLQCLSWLFLIFLRLSSCFKFLVTRFIILAILFTFIT